MAAPKNNPSAAVAGSRGAAAPLHAGVVMDGNGRWAKQRGLPRTFGHKAGVDALKRTPHPSHFCLEDTLRAIVRFKPRRAVLTNMHIDMDYDTLRAELPAGVEPAYDGLKLPL